MKGQDLIDKLERQMQAPSPEAVQTNGHATPKMCSGSAPSDDAIIEKCRGASNSAKFEALFDHGDVHAYHGGDASAADFALLGILKLYTQDPDQLERLMRRSRLARRKWEEKRAGRSWLRYSIDNALKDVGEVYDWSKEGGRLLSSSANSPSASSSDLLGNGEMLVMRTIERPADPLGELVGPQKPVELHDPPFPVYPLGLDGVQPRTLLRKKATHDPHPTAAVFDLPVVFSEPSPDLLGDVPARVVPDEHQHFLARRLELFGAPRKEPRRYTAHGPAVDEPQPHLAADLGQVEPVAGDRFGIGVVLGDRLLDHTMGLSPLGEAAEGRQGHPAPPALVLKAYGPLRVPVGHLHQSVAPPFFFRRGGRGR